MSGSATPPPGPKKGFLKIVVIGDTKYAARSCVVEGLLASLHLRPSRSVGKTSILERYVNKTFISTYKATIGADFLVRDIRIGDRDLTLQVR